MDIKADITSKNETFSLVLTRLIPKEKEKMLQDIYIKASGFEKTKR